MPATKKPYEQFGTFVLFKKLEADSMSEQWRAAKIEGSALGPLVALRRFTGGNQQAILDAAHTASQIVPHLNGTAFAKHQVIGNVDGVPYIAHEYAGGRSLRHIIDRSRGTGVSLPNPIPIDQAVAISEKAAFSLATLGEMKMGGTRLLHGALIPQLVWITDDGEIRVSGQHLGSAFVGSFANPRVMNELGPYFAPEIHQSGTPTKQSEVYSVGALFYAMLTGQEPPPHHDAGAFRQMVLAAKTTTGEAIPSDLRAVLDRSLTIDPASRYDSVATMKNELSTLAHSGRYSATTFNLAFYVSTLLKKEMEGEAIDRDREAKLNLEPYLAPAPPPVSLPAAAPPVAPAIPPMPAPSPLTAVEPARKNLVLPIAAVAVIAAAGVGGWFLMNSRKSAPAAAAPAVKAQAIPQRPQVVSEPLVASSTAPATATETAAATPAATDEAARKKAFEEAVAQRLQEEMMKLQQEYTRKLQQSQSKQAPVQVASVASTPAPASSTHAQEENAPSAAQLDQQRLQARNETPAVVPTPARSIPDAPAPTPAPAAAEAAAPAVREGDIVDVATLDAPPRVTRAATPTYPMMAMRQRVEATIIITALIDESGEVVDARILRGDKRYGFEEAALKAVRSTRFSPPVKDGKRVKTWFPVPVQFKL